MTTETPSSQRPDCFLVKNFFLSALRASAVNHPPTSFGYSALLSLAPKGGIFTPETPSSQSIFLIKNSFLCVLRASAVNHLIIQLFCYSLNHFAPVAWRSLAKQAHGRIPRRGLAL